MRDQGLCVVGRFLPGGFQKRATLSAVLRDRPGAAPNYAITLLIIAPLTPCTRSPACTTGSTRPMQDLGNASIFDAVTTAFSLARRP